MSYTRLVSTADMPREEWLAWRRRGIGGSDAAALLGLSPFSSPFSVWADKIGLKPDTPDSEALRVGRDLEEYVARRFTERASLPVQRMNALLGSVEQPYMCANIDRRVRGRDAGLECKTTSAYNYRSFVSPDGSVSVPAHYYVQCVHYMAVTGWRDWYLAVLIMGSDFRVYRFTREENPEADERVDGVVSVSDAEIETLIGREREFWALVEAKTPPEVDGTKATTDTINGLYQMADGSVTEPVDLSGMEDVFSRLDDVKAQIKELETQRAELENRIKLRMADKPVGICGGKVASWQNQVTRRIDTEALKKGNPEIAGKYLKESTSRVLRVSQRKEEKKNG